MQAGGCAESQQCRNMHRGRQTKQTYRLDSFIYLDDVIPLVERTIYPSRLCSLKWITTLQYAFQHSFKMDHYTTMCFPTLQCACQISKSIMCTIVEATSLHNTQRACTSQHWIFHHSTQILESIFWTPLKVEEFLQSLPGGLHLSTMCFPTCSNLVIIRLLFYFLNDFAWKSSKNVLQKQLYSDSVFLLYVVLFISLHGWIEESKEKGAVFLHLSSTK